jgi:Ala-tRNA(Pro) deacylase
MDTNGLLEYLEGHGIRYNRFDHQAVFTCEESNRLLSDVPGARTKNILLLDD